MSNDELAGNTNGNGFARRTRLGNRMLEHLAPALMQIESNGRELVMCDKVVERVTEAESESSTPTTLTSSGTRKPLSRSAAMAPFAIWSFAA